MMTESHGNLVGNVMLKDIYIVKNTINNMVYIGQARDPYERWKHHKTAAKTGHYKCRSLLYEAMRKYGINNFYYEILESKVENYNERERYWIAFYNSVAPNGYNLLEGGEQYPNLCGIMNAGAAVKTQEELESIIDDIKHSKLRLNEIAKKYDVPLNTIHGINQGNTYHNSDIEYPIRAEKIPTKLSAQDVRDIIWFLEGDEYTIKDIAKLYNVSDVTINSINIGATHSDIVPDLERPIRKGAVIHSSVLTEDEVSEIIWMLQNTSISLRAIGRKFGVCHRVIINIKNGSKAYRRHGLNYPLRKNN